MKNLKINIPVGYEIDKEQSTFENIVFKQQQLPKSWEDLKELDGAFVDEDSKIGEGFNFCVARTNKNVFSTKEQAEASIALAQLSQLMKVYNGGWIPDWDDFKENKYCIYFFDNKIDKQIFCMTNKFLSFKTLEIRDEFLENFEDLILTAKPLL